MTALVHLTPLDPHYPSRLRGAPGAPASLTVGGGSLEADRVVAIVGSRRCTAMAERFARTLAKKLAADGIVVASGGAVGIDTAAHVGALAAGGGRTWVVAPTGCEHVSPAHNAALFEAVARGPGAMVWPFAPTYRHPRFGYHARNRVLVALADAVVVVQARSQSGALHAAACARRLGKPLWVAPPLPWAAVGDFGGSRELLADGARALTSVEALVATLAPRARPRLPPLSSAESATWTALSNEPLHLDHVAQRAGLPAQAAAAALLTLSLENVVVEGPPGFFRRRDGH